MKKRSVSFLTNLIYRKRIQKNSEVSEELWQELLDACATFGNFRDAYFYVEGVNEKWEYIFLRKMKETANLQNASQLRALVRFLKADSPDWELHVKNLFDATKKRGSIYAWNELVRLLPKESPLYFQSRKLRSEFKNSKRK